MSDELKIIREALAQMQRRIDEDDTSFNIFPKEYRAPALWKKAKEIGHQAMTGEGPTPIKDIVTGKQSDVTPASSTPKSDATTPKADTPEPPKTTGSVKTDDKPVSVVKTKGGDYNVYAKGSEKAADFRKAYAAAKGNFEWEGRKYAKPSSETSKPATSTDAPLPPKRPEGLGTTTPGKQTLPSIDVGKPSSGPEFPKNKTSGTPVPPSRPETMDSKPQTWRSTEPIGRHGNYAKMSYDSSPITVSQIEKEKSQELANIKGQSPQVAPEPKPLDLNKPESESGGKKKKMSEETNPLIAAFLKLQSENPSNMFEAAKKLSPEQKKKMDVDKDNDIDADDLSALRAGKKGKMEENSLPTMAKPSANADTKSVTTDFSAPDRPAVSMDNKPVVSPTAPKVDTTIPSSDKKALDTKFKTIAREEVEFSQAEIDHINSFFLEASVAPNRPEVARGADSTSDKMSQNDVTGTAESGGKKKIHETSKPEVSVYDNAAHVKDKMGKVVASYSKKDHGSDYMKKANDHMSKIKEEVELDEILSASPKRKIPDWIKRKRNFNGRHDLVKARDLNYDGSKKKPNAEPKKDDVKEDTIPHKQDDVDPKFKSNILTPPKAPVKKFDKKVLSKMYEEEVELEEGRPKKNPTPETMERDPRKHIQVEAGRAAAGNVIDFHHNDGSKSKITPAMGRRIVSHLNGLKPADRQTAVNKMHDSAEGLKV